MLEPEHFPRMQQKSFLVAAFAVTASAAARLGLDPLVHTKVPCLPFLCGVLMAALFGGRRAGLIATILSIPVCDYLFIEPRHTFFIHDARADSIGLGVFLLLGVAASVMIGHFLQTRERLRRTAMKLEESELRFRTLAATMPEMLFTTTEDGRAIYMSPRFSQYTGLDIEQCHEDWMQALHPEDRRPALARWDESVKAGKEFEGICRFRSVDGNYRWFKGHATPVRAADGRILQWTGVCADIHDQKMLEQTLIQRTTELAAVNDQFQKFAYRVSHDLDEPLRTIHSFTEMLVKRNQQRLDGESHELVRYILESTDRVQREVRQLLEYARAGALTIKREPVELTAALEAALASLRSTILQTGATVTHDALPRLIVNPDRIQSVFQNLIGNALKYRGDCPPRIHISAQRADKEWLLSVKDNGIGFEMADAERIFTAFERLSQGREIRGSGLGLAIVKRIVEGKGGRVWAESEPGRGSTFFFSLPRTLESSPRQDVSCLQRAAAEAS